MCGSNPCQDVGIDITTLDVPSVTLLTPAFTNQEGVSKSLQQTRRPGGTRYDLLGGADAFKTAAVKQLLPTSWTWSLESVKARDDAVLQKEAEEMF